MAEVRVRAATLADAAAITAVHCSQVEVWRQGGEGDAAPYESLSLYDRWLHGGPWMSVETCAVHLNRWLHGGHPLLVAEVEGEVIGAAEFVEDDEPAPYGHALHLTLLFVHAAHRREGAGQALVEAGAELARQRRCLAVTTQPEEPARPFYDRVGFSPWLHLGHWRMSARECCLTVQPKPALHTPYPASERLVLRAGRHQCRRQAWDSLPFHLALAEHACLPWGRWQLRLSGGQNAWLGLKARPTEPSQANGFVWAPPEAELQPPLETLQGLAADAGFACVKLLLEDADAHDLSAAMGLEFQEDLVLWRREIAA